MRYDVGNWVFDRAGKPGVIVDRTADGKAIAERSGDKFDKARAAGFINGLKGENRESFNRIVREVRSEALPERRVEILQEKIKELKPDQNSRVLKRYLESEMAFVMNSEGVHPPTFEYEDSKL